MSFDDIYLEHDYEHLPALPRYTPQMDSAQFADFDRGLDWPAYAVGLRRVMSPTTGRLLPGFTGTTAAEAMGLNEGQMPVLVGYGVDPDVEKFWTNRYDLLEEIRRHKWGLVLAPNFSMYGNHPRTEMLLNFRRNLLIAEEMIDVGIPAVPNLYWYRAEDLLRYKEWADRVKPPAVAVNLQTFRTDSEFFDVAVPGLMFLAGVLPASTKVIVTGVSRPARLSKLLELFGPNLHLVGQNALAFARRGALMTSTGRQDLSAAAVDAFPRNVRFYQTFLERGE